MPDGQIPYDPFLLTMLLVFGVVSWIGVGAACVEMFRERARTSVIAFAGIVLFSGMLLWCPPFNASDLRIAPDSVEYVAGALRLMTDGTFDITVQGQDPLPSRYSPWFSAWCLVPAFTAMGAEPGNGTYVIFFWALLGVVCAYKIGAQLSGHAGAVCAALALVLDPLVCTFAKRIMTEIPSVALWLLLASRYIDQHRTRRAGGLLDGVLAGFAFAMRPTNLAVFIPMIAAPAGGSIRWTRTVMLLFPSVAVAGLTLYYQNLYFGSPWRTGYQFWAAVPYDYPSQVFAAGFVPGNLACLATRTLLPALPLMLVFVWRNGAELFGANFDAARRMVLFTTVAGAPCVVFYLLYFFEAARFYLPLEAMAVVLYGAVFGALVLRVGVMPEWMVKLVPAALLCATAHMPAQHLGQRHALMRAIQSHTPADATVIITFDPLYARVIDGFDTGRTYLPLSRRVEYASKLIAWKKPERADSDRPWTVPSLRELQSAGAKYAVSDVALEIPGDLVRRLASGTRIFLVTKFPYSSDPRDIEEMDRLLENFRVVPVAENLHELLPVQS